MYAFASIRCHFIPSYNTHPHIPDTYVANKNVFDKDAIHNAKKALSRSSRP